MAGEVDEEVGADVAGDAHEDARDGEAGDAPEQVVGGDEGADQGEGGPGGLGDAGGGGAAGDDVDQQFHAVLGERGADHGEDDGGDDDGVAEFVAADIVEEEREGACLEACHVGEGGGSGVHRGMLASGCGAIRAGGITLLARGQG